MSFLKEIKFLRVIGRFRRKELAMLTFVDYVTKALKEPNLFFNKVEEITGKKGYIQWGTLPYRDDDMFDSKADIKNINKVLNWTPTHSIEDGLNKTIDWYKRKIR